MKWIGGVLLALLVVATVVWFRREDILLHIGQLRAPKMEAYHEVTWAEGPATADTPADKRPPNIVFILADDMGFNDITFNGGGVANGAVPTPNIDSIGHQGVSFANGYAGNATCAPSRAAIMTGRYPTRFGFEFTPTPVAFEAVVGTAGRSGDFVHPRFFADRMHDMIPMERMGVPASETTIAEVLRARGYHTLQFGKWHLGAENGMRPEQQGFDESLGFMPGASLYLPVNDPNVVNSRQDFDPIDRFLWANLPYGVQFNGSPWFHPNAYMTDYLATEAIRSIHANRNRPFFIYFAPNAIHTPLQATKEDYDALPQIQNHEQRVYGAMVRNLDRNVGRILQALRDEGLDRNTLVIFTSDNGGAHYIGLPDINRPYRGFKATFFEGGIHTPFFMRWPAQIAAGTRYAAPVSHFDIFATAAAAASAPIPQNDHIDGVNVLPFVEGHAQGMPHETLFWRSGQYRVVLDHGWKLQDCGACHRVWLFDMANDPTEHHDLSAEQPDRVRTMRAMLDAFDRQQARPQWPSLLEGPIFVDQPLGVPQKQGGEYIWWDN
ncbi:MAG: sulfatase-like hydrolase/transferase [Terricaulis sp.]